MIEVTLLSEAHTKTNEQTHATISRRQKHKKKKLRSNGKYHFIEGENSYTSRRNNKNNDFRPRNAKKPSLISNENEKKK